MKATAYLQAVGLYEVIIDELLQASTVAPVQQGASSSSSSSPEPGVKSSAKLAVEKTAKAYAFLMMSLDNSTLGLFMGLPAGDPKRLWEALCKHYERDTLASKHAIREMLHGERLKDGEDVNQFIGRIIQHAEKLNVLKAPVHDEDKVFVLFKGLPDAYASIISSLKVLDQQNQLTFQIATQHIKDYQELMKTREKTKTGESANYLRDRNDRNRGYSQRGRGGASHRGHGSNRGHFSGRENNYNQNSNDNNKNFSRDGNKPRVVCQHCKKPGHQEEDCWSKQNNSKDKIIHCHNCGEPGHIAKGCRTGGKKDEKSYQGKEGDGSDTDSEEYDYAGHVADLEDKLTVNYAGESASTRWILDSGCTSHFAQNVNLLRKVKDLPCPTTVNVANQSTVEVTQGGKSLLKGEGGKMITIEEVKHAPQFSDNLLSVSRLVNNGATVTFTSKEAVVEKDGEPLFRGTRVGNLYYIQGQSKEYASLGREPEKTYKLLHDRLGHMGYSSMKKLIDSNAVAGTELFEKINPKEQRLCEGCELGKAHRQAFKKYSSKPQAEAVLERIYCDLSGPVKEIDDDGFLSALNNPQYLSLIVDEKSRRLSGKLLKKKSEAPEHITTWVTQAENQLGKKLKYFHSDEGTEYVNHKLQGFCERKGIKIELTCVGTPQHNGIAERANRSVFEMARSMLYQAKLSTSFWGEAVLTAIYLLNRSTTRQDKMRTREEIWSGHKPSIDRVRVFGCDAYVHVQDEKRKKMDPKSVKCIFIGYDDEKEMGYRFFDPEKMKITVSRDADFDEVGFTAGRADGAGPKGSAWDTELDRVIVKGWGSYVSVFHPRQATEAYPEAEPEPAPGPVPEEKVREPGDRVVPEQKAEPQEGEKKMGSEFKSQPLAIKSRVNRDLQGLQDSLSKNYELNPETSSRARKMSFRVDLGDIYPPDLDQLRNRPGNHSANLVLDDEPATYEEAMNRPEADKWRKAAEDEITALRLNQTWDLIPLPAGCHAIGSKWVFKRKMKSDGTIERYKARFCAKGFSQEEGIDYNETFAPVVKYKSLRIILALAAELDYELKQMDVVTAFLNAKIKETVYMKQPEGFEIGERDMVCKLNKTLYGTKQAPHEWNEALNGFIVSMGFNRCVSDTCVYVKKSATGNIIIISIFVDDILSAYATEDSNEWKDYKALFMKKFEMKDMGDVEWILGMRVRRNRQKRELKLDQQQYLQKVIERFRMTQGNPAPTPEQTGIKLSKSHCPSSEDDKQYMRSVPYRSAVGSLLYAAIGTRPDIAHAVNEVSKYMSDPGVTHWQAVKRILRYLKGTLELGLTFTGSLNLVELKNHPIHNQIQLHAYSDADWAGDKDDRKSTTGYIIQMNNSTVSWGSKKQKTVALSSAEAEYMAIGATAQEAKWVSQLLSEIFITGTIDEGHKPVIIYTDNQSALAISKNDLYHDRTKHIDLRHHFIRQGIKEGLYEIRWISTTDQLADMFTKGLGTLQFARLRQNVMEM